MASTALQVGTPSPGAIRRLQQEMKLLAKSPPDGIVAKPDESNILLWHYVLTGPKGTPYEGGTYLGKLRFPPDYPFAPPSILMTTPNGRFKTDMRLCLSISDYHPKEWNPVWNVSTILTGLLSFMVASDITAGSMESTPEQKKYLARHSHEFNAKFPVFRANFPELIDEEEHLAFAVANPHLAQLQRPKEEEAGASHDGTKKGLSDGANAPNGDASAERGGVSSRAMEREGTIGAKDDFTTSRKDNNSNNNNTHHNTNNSTGSSSGVPTSGSGKTNSAASTTGANDAAGRGASTSSADGGATNGTSAVGGAHLIARTSSKNTAVVVKAPSMVSALYDTAWSLARRLIIVSIQFSVAAVALAFVVLMTM